jgi:pyridoxine 5'-phosphate synthase PdxJ
MQSRRPKRGRKSQRNPDIRLPLTGLRPMRHGLNYSNIKKMAALAGIDEFNIGHSIISRAVLVGLDRAVRDMLDLLKAAQPD